jgi:hypothetical protein
MKKHLPFYLCFVALAGLLFVGSVDASELTSRLKGKILLQVEQNGEAWYVNPDNETRYYLGRPQDAFNLMRSLGLGISNRDFDSFEGYAPNRLSGKILLKVEDSGKAYYVNPDDLKMHYLGRPADAFRVMRELGLGISDKNLNLISRYIDLKDWTTRTSKNFNLQINHPKTWSYEETNTGFLHILMLDENTQITISPLGHVGRGLWVETPKITNVIIGGKNATRKDWHLDDGSVATYIKFNDFPNGWNEDNSIIIEGYQNKEEVIETILKSIKFTK